MVSGNEFSTFGLSLLSQTDSYLFKDPEARVANYTPHNRTNKKKKSNCRPFFCLSQRIGTTSVFCMCVTENGSKERKRLK